jgi:hypothetical protein
MELIAISFLTALVEIDEMRFHPLLFVNEYNETSYFHSGQAIQSPPLHFQSHFRLVPMFVLTRMSYTVTPMSGSRLATERRYPSNHTLLTNVLPIVLLIDKHTH